MLGYLQPLPQHLHMVASVHVVCTHTQHAPVLCGAWQWQWCGTAADLTLLLLLLLLLLCPLLFLLLCRRTRGVTCPTTGRP
jgi:hypothetical protein